MKYLFYRNLILFLISSSALLGTIVFSVFESRKLNRSLDAVEHTFFVINTIENIVLKESQSESAIRGYWLTGKKSFLENYRNAVTLTNMHIEKLKNLTIGDLSQERNIKQLKSLFTKKSEWMNQSLQLHESTEWTPQIIASKVNEGKMYSQKIMDLQEKIKKEEEILLNRKEQSVNADITGTDYAILLSFLFTFTLGIVNIYFIMKYFRKQKDYQESLVKLNDNKNKFFSIIGHDLRGPVYNILRLSEMLTEKDMPCSEEEKREFNRMIGISAKKVNDLLNNLLKWSSIQMNMIRISPQQIPLWELVEDNFIMLEETAKDKGINLVNLVTKDIILWADKEMINTILRNLISNGIKFTDKKGKIIISAEQKDKTVEISVKDNGVGISKERICNLFKEGEKLTTKGTANEDGTGLGLRICKEFIEKNGGQIWAESVQGEGTVFRFSVPSTSYTVGSQGKEKKSSYLFRKTLNKTRKNKKDADSDRKKKESNYSKNINSSKELIC